MRLDPVFVCCVAVPLALTGLSLAPFDWGGRERLPPAQDASDSLAAIEEDWIAPFTRRLSARAIEPPAVLDHDPLDGWRLVGLVQGDEGAWITVTGSGEVRTLSLGETLAGYELIRLEDGAAVFRRSDEERTLRLPR